MNFHRPFQSWRFFSGVVAVILALYGFAGCGDREDAGEPAADGDTAAASSESFDGKSYTYDVVIDMDHSTVDQGVSMNGTMHGTGSMIFTEGKATEKGERWRAVTNLSMSGDMMGTAIDTVKQEQTVIYTFTPEGKFIDVEIGGVDGMLEKELMQMIGNTSERQNARLMFIPKEWLQKKEGESWEEQNVDTINVKDVAFGTASMRGDVFLVIAARTRYTHAGTVDTLGQKAVRLKYELVDLTLDGTMNAKEIEISLSSKGSGTGLFYYTIDDGLQLASRNELTTDLVVAMPSMNQTMPMKQHMVTTVGRRQ